MEKAIDENFPENINCTHPDGGFYIWIELPQGLDAKALLPVAIEEIKVTYCIGRDFFVEETAHGNQYLRLSYAGTEEDVVEEHVGALGRFFKSQI